MKINTVSPDKHKYVRCLNTIAKTPERLFVSGELPPERNITVAIVGTRSPTTYGTQVACEFAYMLAKKGIVIISGLAFGIDKAAHEGALQAGGTTIAVMAHGLDQLYPRSHTRLAHTIISNGGALISEYPEGTEPLKHRFLERNRLVSGLADALLVVEAGEKSGTWATVQSALEQGKEVFAIPGPITSAQSKGPNKLIADGAHPALHPDDIVARIAPHLLKTKARILRLDPQEQLIITMLEHATRDTDSLIAGSGLSPSRCLEILTILELDGVVRALPQAKWTLR